VKFNSSDNDEDFQDRLRSLRKRKLAENMRHLSQQTSAAKSILGRRPQKNAIEAADMAVLKEFQFETFEFFQALLVRCRAENARWMLWMHLRGHGGERKNTFD